MNNKENVLLISIDIREAFDVINHSFIVHVLLLENAGIHDLSWTGLNSILTMLTC